jgi:hypothetical protein
MERLQRDIRVKFHINADTNRVVTDRNGKVDTLKSTGYDPKLYMKSQDYEPDEGSPQIENAINAFEQSLQTLVRSNNATVTRKHNLPASSRLLLTQLKSNNNFIILPTDKNLGPAILEQQVNIQRCLQDHLSNSNTYRRLTPNKARQKYYKAEQAISLLILKHRFMLVEHKRISYFHHRVFQHLPQFYTIPKVHKTPWATRPIISCVNSNLGYLSKYVDRQLQQH